ncbi:hypothetical protein J6590_016427 [Homalodisca vitripennis]|nr:hypothetical protein J6590_016427 [Homalodisca vitripennis]
MATFLQTKDEFNSKTARICSENFLESDYERHFISELLGLPPRRKLKESSLPTQKIPTVPTSTNNLGSIERRICADKRSCKKTVKSLIENSAEKRISEITGEELEAQELGIHSGRQGRLGVGDVTASQPDAREPYRLVIVTVD